MVMKLAQIIEAIKNNHLETVKKELVRYGDILESNDWESEKGCHRRYIIKRLDSVFVVAMLNGDTLTIKQQN
jgi:hypothetical protein